MSVERQVRRALWRVTLWRLIGDSFGIIPKVFSVIALFFNQFANTARGLEQAIFYMELDAARKYRSLTGTDLALAQGDATRYASIDPAIAEARDAQMGNRQFLPGGEDEE